MTQLELYYNTRSSDTSPLTVPKLNTAFSQHTFFPSTINRWNKISKEAQDGNSIISFKHFVTNNSNIIVIVSFIST